MGILDDLLGGLVLMALMPIVLQLLSNRGAGGGSGTGGGIADVLGQVLGGAGEARRAGSMASSSSCSGPASASRPTPG
jgi:hypothetical protein